MIFLNNCTIKKRGGGVHQVLEHYSVDTYGIISTLMKLHTPVLTGN